MRWLIPSQAMRLILLTRKDPALPIATLRGSGLVTEIRISDLMFTPDEAAAFLHGMLGIDIDMETAKLLDVKTEGWAVGLRLAGLYLRGENDPKARVRELSGRSSFIADYLFAEVLSRQNSELVAYLLEVSILDRFCEPLCHYMHHDGSQPAVEAEHFIQWLKESSLFAISLDDEGHWFRFHHLFKDFLQAMLRKKKSKGRIEALHRLAASWFADQGLIEEAIEHFLKAGKTDDAVQLIIDKRNALMNNSEFSRLSHWLDMLPEPVLLDNPFLLSTKALIGIDLGKNVDIHAFTKKAKQYMENHAQKQQTSTLFGEVLLMEAIVDLVLENVEEGAAKSKQAFALLPEDAQVAHSFCILIEAVAHQSKGESQKAIALVQKQLNNPAYTINSQVRICAPLAIVHFLDANLDEVRKTAQYNLQLTRGMPLYHTRTYAYVNLGIACYLQNDFQSALPALQKAVEHRYVANPNWVTDACFALVCLYLARGQHDAADQVMAQIKKYCREGNHQRSLELYPAFEIEALLRQKKVQQASTLVPGVDFEVRAPRYFFYIPQLTECKYLIALDTAAALNKAHDKLKKLDEGMRAMHRVNVRIDLLILLSLVCLKRGRRDEAIGELGSALALAAPGKWIRSFLDAGDELIPLLQQLAENGRHQTFIQQILQSESAKLMQTGLSSQTSPNHQLTSREQEILPLLASGLSNKEIASQLCISAFTVKTHLQNIYKKLNVKGRIEAVNKVMTLNLNRQ
jgi:LuxR family maltose regulon positive regulatory protein